MSERLVIDGNAVYEIDEDCMRQQDVKRRGRQRARGQTACNRRLSGMSEEKTQNK